VSNGGCCRFWAVLAQRRALVCIFEPAGRLVLGREQGQLRVCHTGVEEARAPGWIPRSLSAVAFCLTPGPLFPENTSHL
jgi:hypothetical protein